MEWLRQTSLKLIDEIRIRRCLWDPTFPDYKNRLIKLENFSELGVMFNVSAREIENKWHILKSQFAREDNKVISSKKLGTGREFIPRWYAYDAMLFVKKSNKKPTSRDHAEYVIRDKTAAMEVGRKFKSSLDLNNYESRRQVQIPGQDIIKDENADIITEETSISENSDPLLEENTGGSVDEIPISFLSPNHKKRRSDCASTQLSRKRNECIANNEEHNAFSKFVESELHEIKNKRRLAILKKRIQDVIFEAKMEEMDEIESDCSSPPVNLVSIASTSSNDSLLGHPVY